MASKIGVAILGAGIFAKEEHLPNILALERHYALKAVYSRSQKAAEELAVRSKDAAVASYFDSPSIPGKSLDDLLARNDIQAVVICLPILAQPPVIRKALAAGKHVLSEKPIAPDVTTAKELVNYYGTLTNKSVWAVGENFRFIEPIVEGAKLAAEMGGKIETFNVELFTLLDDNDKYFNTDWRKTPDYQGGFLLDGGVHFIAGLRLLLNAVGDDVSSVSAHTALHQEKLQPVDTVHAVVGTQGGRSGIFSVSFGTAFKSGFQIQVATSNGIVTVSPMEAKRTSRDPGSGEKVETAKQFGFAAGVRQELDAFAASVQAGRVDIKQRPGEALKDLEILQAMLESGRERATPKAIARELE